MLDWRDADAYRFAAELDAGGWAWEFLRRNPDYQQEWQAFITTWRALEAEYGRAPNRDFCAWKLDPRAWLAAAECEEGDCRIDGDKVLIECALGARWGFYKFPPDPAADAVVQQERLAWRAVELPTHLQSADERPDSGQVALVFDLQLPLAAQLEQAKRLLQIEQRRQIKKASLLPPRIAAHGPRLTRMLQLLDGAQAGAEPSRMVQVLGFDSVEALDHALEEAKQLRDGGYRRLLLLD